MNSRHNQFEKRKPLLYIIQPESKEITLNMQSIFTRKIGEEDHKDELSKNEKDMSIIEHKTFDVDIDVENAFENQKSNLIDNEEIEMAIQNNEETNDESLQADLVTDDVKRVTSGYPRRSFKKMDISEKLYFLTNKPRYLPNVIVQINTETNDYTGIILSFGDGEVLLDQLLMGHKPLIIPIKEIINIKMVSN
ncbi:CotO family spore coat protein [Heyndrickxia sporothermodurans]